MRNFNFQKHIVSLLTPDIVNLLSAIQEYRGKRELYIEAKPDILDSMLEAAKIQSTGASNRIEGIYTSDARLQELIHQKSEPLNRSEQEIVGYREVLNTIHESYEYVPPRPNIILQLHRDLYSYSGSSTGGHFKNTDNIIEEVDLEGVHRIRFQPVPAYETPEAVDKLCIEYETALNKGLIDPLLLIPMFVLDFLCIHPFNDGNGRMSRLLTLLLLYRENYIVGKYISLEMLIEKSKVTYYESLQESSVNWHAEQNNYVPFVAYYLTIILSAYKEFASRVEHLRSKGTTKAKRIQTLFENRLGKLSKAEIAALCPDISVTTIEKVLSDLLKEKYIVKVGTGRSTAYISNHE
ncbi:MAG: Fic family protein [Bacillota bacterium]|nr:Fic family protein [Bacillota bacterium]